MLCSGGQREIEGLTFVNQLKSQWSYMKWMHQMMIPLTLMCWCVMSLDVGKLCMQPPTTQLVHYIIPDVSVWCGGVFIFVSLGEMCSFQNASRHELRHGTKVLIIPRDYRGDRRSVKKYLMNFDFTFEEYRAKILPNHTFFNFCGTLNVWEVPTSRLDANVASFKRIRPAVDFWGGVDALWGLTFI